MRLSSFSRWFRYPWLSRSTSLEGTQSRPASRARLDLEHLEERTTPSALPAVSVLGQTDISNYLGAILPPTPSTREPGEESSPTIAVDPLNPQRAVAAWVVSDPTLPSTVVQRTFLQTAFTLNGGLTWSTAATMVPNLIDPTTVTTTTPGTPYPQATDPTIGIDRTGNVFIVYAEHITNNGAGAIVLQAFDSSMNQTILNKIIYRWNADFDSVFNPVMVVDNNVPTFNDPTTGAKQGDPFSGSIYVAWNTQDVPPPDVTGFNPNTIRLVVSSDHGANFSGQFWLNSGINFGTDRDGQPALTILQGTSDNRIPGGSVVAVWDDFGSASAPGRIIAAPVAAGASSTFADNSGGAIADAGIGQAQTASFPTTVNQIIPDGGSFTAPTNPPVSMQANVISKITVTVNIQASRDGDIRITLITPDGTRIVLSNGNGAGGANYTNTTFDDASTTPIQNGQPPFTGSFAPQEHLNKLLGTNPNGVWKLEVDDLVAGNNSTQELLDFTLNITATQSVQVATDFVLPINITDPNFTTLSNLEVTLNLQHPNLSQVEIDLVAPSGETVMLVDHRLDTSGGVRGNPPFGISGTAMGFVNPSFIDPLQELGTIFEENAPRAITSPGAPTNFVGMFQTEGGATGKSFALRHFFGRSAAQLKGNWTLRITDFVNGPGGAIAPILYNWKITFTSGGFAKSNQSVGTSVLGSVNNIYPLRGVVSEQIGIGPSPVLAADNTLGAFSAFQGRTYLAWVDAPPGPILPPGQLLDSSKIFLSHSDNGGLTWSAPEQVNDDNLLDGFSEGNRPHMLPAIAVDQTTGTLVVSFFDARNDAARARVAYYITTSINGGASFSPQTFAEASQPTIDAITGQPIAYEPIPENQSSGNPNSDALFGFGVRTSIAAEAGNIYPIWSGNMNGSLDLPLLRFKELDIYTARVRTAGGPRVVSSTMGPVQTETEIRLDGTPVTFNNLRASDGTLMLNGFVVTFDRNIDISTFTNSQVAIFYRTPTTPANQAGTPIQVGQIIPLQSTAPSLMPQQGFGTNRFLVTFGTAQSAVGTYSYSVGPSIRDLVRSFVNTLQPPATPHAYTLGTINLPIPPDQNTGDTGGPNSPPTQSSLVVNNIAAGQGISHVSVTIDINHTSDRDLIITLIAPDGTPIVLSKNEGGSGANYTATTFDDLAPTAISAGSPPFTGPFRPEEPLATLIGKNPNGTWTLLVQDVFPFNVGTLVDWTLNIDTEPIVPAPVSGNKMDQNANAIRGENPADIYAAPASQSGVPFTIPYKQDTLPLIVPGPHVVSTSVPGSPATPDNLVLNKTNNAIDVVFDRQMQASSFTPSQVLRIVGPAGLIPGPYTVIPNPNGNEDPNFPKTFRITFPLLPGSPNGVASGTYTVLFGPNILSKAGDLMDQNQNAGLDALRSVSSTNNQTQMLGVDSTNVPLAVPASKTVTSTLTVNDSFVVEGITLRLNMSSPRNADLVATLVAPDGTSVRLFTHVGNSNGTQGFVNTVFDDNAVTPIQAGTPPFNGTFNPQTPLDILLGHGAGGTWKLMIRNDSTQNVSTLTGWTLNFTKGKPGSGLGEGASDEATASFRIFNMDATNPLSRNTWTAVGPAANNSGFNSGRITGLTVDPSDPTGNTVFIGGASGGVWKTTNFLTTNPLGPTWVPLTDFGPGFAINIGGIGIFGRNNDPNQSIVFAATGEGDTFTQGAGVIRSFDGGLTWTLLDSTTNVDSSGNPLPLNSPLRDHAFVGLTAFKVAVDPTASPSGDAIVYVAFSDTLGGTTNRGGVFRSLDSGKHWTKLLTGQATDVLLAPDSSTSQTNNLQIVFAGMQGQGVFISPNQGATWTLMAGGVGDPLIQQFDVGGNPPPPVPVVAPTKTPNGVKGRIVLATPALTGNVLADKQLEGWLYALVATTGSTFDGLYLTKDFGQNWTTVRIPSLQQTVSGGGFFEAISNNKALPDHDPFAPFGSTFKQGNYDISLIIDPNDPNVVYVGGTNDGQPLLGGGMLRVNTKTIWDPHNMTAFSSQQADGGTILPNSAGAVILRNVEVHTNPGALTYGLDPFAQGSTGVQTPFINLIRDPNNPFFTNATIGTDNLSRFTNDGSHNTYVTISQFLDFTTDMHRAVAIKDPVSGHTRLILADDQGVYTGIDDGSGNIFNDIGTTGAVTVARSGNLQITQFYYGASQPSNVAAQIAGALFYGNAQDDGQPQSDPNVLSNGNLNWTGPLGDGTGVATDQTGSGTVYHYNWPCCGGDGTNFFQVTLPGAQPIGRTFGLLQASPDPQWPFVGGFNFTVNPISASEIIISSAVGRVFRTQDQGITWFPIGQPADLDSTNAPALAFGAPDPNAIGNLDNFIYAGTIGGHIFVTFTGGGSGGQNGWLPLSAGLDGSSVPSIVADPLRGSHDAFAVTNKGVYRMFDSTATGATWKNITGNLFSLMRNAFGDPNLKTPILKNLTSIAADWRFAIKDNPGQANSPTHPVLYVGGEGGVFRSTDGGATWTIFPDASHDGALVDGGLLPEAKVTQLSIAYGNINPITGKPDQSGGPGVLLATTYGRGSFAIRLPKDLTSGPRVISFTPTNVSGPISQVTVTFNAAVDPSSFNAGSFDTFQGPNGAVPLNQITVALVPPAFGQPQTFTKFTISFPTQSTQGTYTMTFGPNVRDFSGNAMDQNQNGINGEGLADSFTGHFTIAAHSAHPEFAVGADAGGGPEVKVFDEITHQKLFDFYAYSPFFNGGVRVAMADVNGDGVPDIITAPGAGGGPDIRVFDGLSGVLIREFMAYNPAFTGGVFVAAADVNGDGFADIVTGAGAGGGPEVKVFSGKDLSVLMDFMAYSPFFNGGVSVAAGDINGDGFADIVTGAGPGGGPHVKVFNGKDGTLLEGYYAYNPTFSGGVNVAVSDVLGTGKPDIITGPASQGQPQVKVFNGMTEALIESFFAFDPHFLGGVRVGGIGDINNDGGQDIIVGAGPGGGPQVIAFDGSSTQAILDSFYAFSPFFNGGVFVGGQ
jgi:subtilisin-like proprotein convertase family protein